jgi:hypothetical protein
MLDAIELPARLRKARLSRQEAADFIEARHGLKVSAATLAKLAYQGTGPAFARWGRAPVYAPAALDAWVFKRLVPTERLGTPPTFTVGT